MRKNTDEVPTVPDVWAAARQERARRMKFAATLALGFLCLCLGVVALVVAATCDTSAAARAVLR